MCTQSTFKKTLAKFSVRIAFLLFMLNSLFVSGQGSRNARWTEMSKNKNATFYDVQKNFNKEWKGKLKEMAREEGKVENGIEKEEGGFEVYKKWESFMAPRVYPSGDMSLPSTNYEKFIAWQQNQQQNNRGGNPSALSTGNWTSLGPVGKPGGCLQCTGAGRVNFVRFDPTNSNTLYVGAPDGGLWKSTNGGTSWTTNTDFLSVIGCSDLAIDPTNTNIMYLATGDIEGDKNSIGILKSTNGGTTWNATGLTFAPSDFTRICKILMNPSNPLNILVATNAAIYRSTDGGSSFTLTHCCTSFKDMEFKPGDPNTLYAASDEFWKSTDNGVTWNQITSGLPAIANIQRIAIGVSVANPAYVYALIGNAADQSFLGLYRSTNSGTSFSLRSSSPNLLGYDPDGLDAGGQAFYDLSIAVNPTNAEVVTTGGVNHWQSTNGGTNWTIKTYWFGGGANPPFVHADIHEINYLPGSGTTFFSCNDGGIFKTTDDGTTWADISNNLSISQQVKIGLSASTANLYIAGMQDNGTNLNSGSTWTNVYGGDGGECFIDRTNNSTLYASYVYAAWKRSTNGGTSFTAITTGLPNGNTADFYSTWHQDPVTTNTLYSAGYPALYKSTNQGTNWSALGTPTGSGNIVDFAIAPSSATTIYAIKYNAISKSTNGGTSFANITGTLPVANAALTNLCVSNTDANKVWVTFSGYSAGEKVFKSTNGGTSWTNISTGLPNLPMNTIVYKNNSVNDELYVGGDLGVYYFDNTLASWAAFNTSLPNVSIRDLEIFYPTSKLRAGTYGRGTWESDLYTTTACGTPVSLSATSITQTTATLNWGAVASATSYNIQYRVSPAGAWTLVTSATNSKAISGLTANTAYDFEVQAVCTSAGTYSTVFTFSTLANSCGTPTSLSATSITQTTATLNWGAVASATSYNVQYRVSPAGAWTLVTSTTNSKAISGLTANTAYDFEVQAVCTVAGIYSSIATFNTLATGCGTPMSLSATSITQTTATLNWGAVASATSYNIQYRVSPAGGWISTTSTTTSKAISSLTANTAYDFQVQAVCTTVGAYSSIATFTTLPVTTGCGIPAVLSITGITPTKATFNLGTVSGATKYNVSYRVSGTTAWSSKTVTTTTVNLSGLFSGTIYNYRVRAYCTAWGAYSATQNFTTAALPTACNGTDYYETNNTISTAAPIAPNTNIYPKISSATDKDYFKVTTTTSAPKMKIDLDGLPFDYDVELYLSSSGALLGSSANSGTTAEQIIYNAATTGTIYKVQVFGYNGAFDASNCYHLRVSTSASNFREADISIEQDEQSDVMNLYPNPANNQLTIDLLSDKNQTTTINVVDMLGRSILNIKKDLSDGQNKLKVDLSTMQQGIYTVRVNMNRKNVMRKLVIEK